MKTKRRNSKLLVGDYDSNGDPITDDDDDNDDDGAMSDQDWQDIADSDWI